MYIEILAQNAINKECSRKNNIIFVHGAYHGAWCWKEHYMTYFSKSGYACFAVSLRGHGNSDGYCDLETNKLSDYVYDIKFVYEKMKINSAILVGHSFGGAIVQLFAQKYPEKVDKMILMSSIPPNGMLFEMSYFALFHPIKFFKLATVNFRKNIYSVNDFGALFLSKDLSIKDRKKYCKKLQKDSIHTNVKTLKPIINRHYTPKVKTLVIGSKTDIMLTQRAIEKTVQFYRASKVILNGVFHDVMLDPKWEVSANAIIRFLKEG